MKAELEVRVRALELELGLREWDARDVSEARARRVSLVRYDDPESVAEFVEQERRRLTGDSAGDGSP